MRRLIDDIREYSIKFKEVPFDQDKRIAYLLDKKKYNDKDLIKLQNKIDDYKSLCSYEDFNFVIYLVPKPSPRPRMVFGSRRCYVEGAAENSKMFEQYLISLKEERPNIIITPCEVTIKYYMPIPEDMGKIQTLLAELGIIRPVITPDCDNVAKAYIDMTQKHLLLNDSLVVKNVTEKFYSCKPRVEITIKYLTLFDSKYTKRKVEGWKYYKELKNPPDKDSII